MKMLTRIATLLIFLFSATAFAAPADPVYSTDSSRIFWFLVITDQHITARDSEGPERLEWILNDCLGIVEPEMIFNMGDLTDASRGEPLVSVYPGQQDEEWQLYADILAQSGITADRYLDIPGNHDQYNEKSLDHYLQYSMGGQTFGATQHSVLIEKPWGNYHFVLTDTAGNDGAIFPLDNAGLDLGELVFIQNALNDNTDARLTFVLGHHPIVRPDLGFKLGEGSDEIQAMLGDYNVRAYFYGHTHEWRELYWPDNELMPITLHENVDSLGKSDDENMLLVSVDNDTMHLRKVKSGEFPWVVVTTPADIGQGGDNPWAVDVPAGMEQAPVRALAFTSDPFLTCEYRLDNGGWHMMEPIGDHIYQGFMDTRGMQPGAHTMEVRAMPGPATGHKVTFMVTAYTCGDGVDNDDDGLTDYPDDPGCESVTDPDEYNDPVVADEGAPDVIETPDTVIEDDAGSDSGDYDNGTEIGEPDNGSSDDTVEQPDIKPDTGPDTGTLADLNPDDTRESDQAGPNPDASMTDTITAPDSGSDAGFIDGSGGGCTAGTESRAAPFMILVIVAVFLLNARRGREILK